MQLLKAEMPDAHLLLVGDFSDKVYCDSVIQRVGELALGEHVSYLGARQDIPAILRACDIGVLGSRSEGLPLALLEYGMAEMATVVTNVGQCPEVVDGGAAGILVPPASSQALADALRSLLISPERRRGVRDRLQRNEWKRNTAHRR
jgi:glycosyltransferase involved in cell wall biosynthesis